MDARASAGRPHASQKRVRSVSAFAGVAFYKRGDEDDGSKSKRGAGQDALLFGGGGRAAGGFQP
mgnify:CR=1 FL=1